MLTTYDDLNNMCKNTKHLDYVFITEKINNKDKNKSDAHIDSKKYITTEKERSHSVSDINIRYKH